jgi:DNA-binding beta-propeller fold protein YncE
MLAPRARAANRIYWANYDGESLAYWNLDGSGGGGLDARGATVDGPMGIALNPAHGQIYWANWGSEASPGRTISVANLDGSGEASTVPINPSFVNGPHGLAIDPAAGKLYWPNFADNTIGFANLDGSGAGHLRTGTATISGPRGVAIDPASRRIYWANYGPGGMGTTISWASVANNNTGANLMTVPATVDGPEGVALDPPNNRIYWGNYGAGQDGDTIAYAHLDGTGNAHDLPTPGVTPHGVHGVALDPVAGRVYWANYAPGFGNGKLGSAATDGSGASFLSVNLAQAAIDGPVLPNLLYKPEGTGAPTITGEASVGSTLSCGQGTWAGDRVASLFYRAPQRFAYQWTLDSKAVQGASEATLKAPASGSYRCVVTATNVAGAASQTSEPLSVVPSNHFKFGKLKRNKRNGTATLTVTVPDPGKLKLAGHNLKPASKRVKGSRAKLPIRAKGKTKAALAAKGKVKVKAAVTFKPKGGKARTEHKRLSLIEN